MSPESIDSTRDAFLDGRVHVHQPKDGFRGGTDSVLLSAAVNADARGEALELGCGSGAALLPAAWRAKQLRFIGIEKDEAALELARRGIDDNGFGERVSCERGDVAALPEAFRDRFDLVFSNPPFFEADRTEPPSDGKREAYLESMSLEDWLQSMLFCLRSKGTLLMIHRAAELARILATLERRTGDIAVLPIRSFPGADAKRVVIRARKGLRRGPTRLLNGLDIYNCKGGETSDAMQNIARHGAALNWSPT